MPQPVATKLWAALEPLSVATAVLFMIVVFVSYRNSTLYRLYVASFVGIVALITMLYLTHFEFEVVGDRVSYGTLFWSRSILLKDLLKVSATRSHGIVPCTVIVFSLTPIEREGQLTGRGEVVNVGRWPLPDAKNWIESVNAIVAQQQRR